MILVKDIELYDTGNVDDVFEILHYLKIPEESFYGQKVLQGEVSIERELVHGELFRAEGQEVFIGWCKKAQVALGLPFKVFREMKSEYNQHYENLYWDKLQREKENKSLKLQRNIGFLGLFLSWLAFNLL